MSFRKKLLMLFCSDGASLCGRHFGVGVQHHPRLIRAGESGPRQRGRSSVFNPSSSGGDWRFAREVESVATSETVQHIALDINRGATDSGEYVSEARTLAGQQQLDFLELVDNRGTILSSAQWEAKFGYPEAAIPSAAAPAGAFLKREELSDGPTLGLFAVRAARVGEQPLYVIGGERLDQGFLSTLDIPAGTRVLLYQSLDAKWNPKSLLDLNGPAAGADPARPAGRAGARHAAESQRVIHWTSDSADAEVVFMPSH